MDQVFPIDLTCYVPVLLALRNMGMEGGRNKWAILGQAITMFAPRYHI